MSLLKNLYSDLLKSNTKAGIEAPKSGYRQATFEPHEYENMPVPKEKTKKYNMSRDTCPVPFEADADAFFTSKD